MSNAFAVLLRCLSYVAIAIAIVALVISPGAAIVWMILALVLVVLSIAGSKK